MSSFRNPYRKKRPVPLAAGTVGADWAAFVNAGDRKIAQLLKRARTPEQPPAVSFYVQPTKVGAKGVILDFTQFTEAELEVIGQLLYQTLELARPVARERDRKAKEDAAAGHRYDPRLYRGVPTRTDISWAVGIDSESICERLAYDAERDPPGSSGYEPPRVERTSMVELDPEEDGTEDDPAETD